VIPPSQTATLNVLKMMFDAVAAGDAQRARAVMKADDAKSQRIADAMTQFLIEAERLRQRVAERFGAEVLAERMEAGGPMLLRDFPQEVLKSPGKPLDDGAWETQGFIIRKEPDGKYIVDIAASVQKVPEIEQWLAAVTAQAKEARAALDSNPTMSLDTLLEQASKRPAPR
jgi:hypothetical protein